MFCLLNQAFATIDHLIWDAVVALHGPNAPESRHKSRHKRPAGGGGSRWKVRRRSRTVVPWGLCPSPAPHLRAGSYLGKKIPNYHPEKYAGPTTGHAVFWGRGGHHFIGGAVFMRVPTRKIQVYAHEIPRSASRSPQSPRNLAGLLCWGRANGLKAGSFPAKSQIRLPHGSCWGRQIRRYTDGNTQKRQS